MLSHHEQVLWQCSNASMTNKLQELVRDVREIFRGDSKHLKGPEAFRLMLTQFEALEIQLQDEEATQSQKAVKFNFAAEGGSGGTLMVVLTPKDTFSRALSSPMELVGQIPKMVGKSGGSRRHVLIPT